MKTAIRLVVLLAFGYTGLSQSLTVDATVANWHKAAADADFTTYSSLMTTDAIFIGTDATELWQGKAFLDFAKPYFDRGKAWSFSTLTRNVYNENSQKIAWFDELLDTQMGICRGSGVLIYEGNAWKIKHYVLSIAIPNDKVKAVTALKKNFDTSFIQALQN